MKRTDTFREVPQALANALIAHGFERWTAVQQAVLDADTDARDLRISSQTGSGKTVAMGLVLARTLATHKGPSPHALFVAPTRELAAQLARELTWMLESFEPRIALVTGGGDYRTELRALKANPSVVIGTPGRLVDHLDRKTLDLSALDIVVLDEADQMLDLGFKEALEHLLASAPKERRTHLISATFPKTVLALAKRYQDNPLMIQGTAPGSVHADISHVVHLVYPEERNAALVNLLLLSPEERTLVFVRTRADASEIAEGLAGLGFRSRAISGELKQRERTQTLDAFREGQIRILVATDVAARGLDVPDITRVIHADPPNDGATLTHRSGRTGRAGQKGTSIMVLTPSSARGMAFTFERAGITPEWRPVPGEKEVTRAREKQFAEALQAEVAAADSIPSELHTLAAKLLRTHDAEALVAALLKRTSHMGPCAPRPVRVVDVERFARPSRSDDRDRAPRGPRAAAGAAAAPTTRRWQPKPHRKGPGPARPPR